MKKLASIDMIDLKIPFKTEFKHHTASRKSTQTVIVVVSDGDLKGYGEACPREYVTGESISTCFEFFEKLKEKLPIKKEVKDGDLNQSLYLKDIPKHLHS